MRIQKYEFQWFEKEDRRRQYRASISRSGRLRLGRTLRQALPCSVRVGFDSRQNVLAIADGHGAGIPLPRQGVLSAQKLSAQITASGLRLPIAFLFTRDEATGYFLGRVLPRRRMAEDTGRREYDTEQLLILYRHVVDSAVNTLARSTPMADRRACAVEAFHAAVRAYCPGYGDMETYLEEAVRDRLRAENRPYAAAYAQPSLDRPLTDDGDSAFCLYDTLAAADDGGIGRLEERIMAEQFLESLTPPERTLARMLREGCPLAQIARAMDRTEGQLAAMGREIGEKRRRFYEVA